MNLDEKLARLPAVSHYVPAVSIFLGELKLLVKKLALCGNPRIAQWPEYHRISHLARKS